MLEKSSAKVSHQNSAAKIHTEKEKKKWYLLKKLFLNEFFVIKQWRTMDCSSYLMGLEGHHSYSS